MNGPSCTMTPQVGGKDSRLYKELLKKLKDKPLTNYMYASYTSSNMGDVMDAAGKERDDNNEHRAKDYLAMANFAKIQKEIMNIKDYEESEGFVDNTGKRIDFTDPEDALNKAKNFNDNHEGVVANVVVNGDVYHIIVSQKDSGTFMQPVEVEQRLQVWDLYKSTFNTIGIDLTSLPNELKTTVNPFTTDLARYLRNLQNTDFKWLNYREGLMLFYLNYNLPEIQELINKFGSLEDAAQGLADYNSNPASITTTQAISLKKAVAECKKFGGIDLRALQDQADQTATAITNSHPDEVSIQKKLQDLNKKYGIEAEIIHRINNKIKKLSDAVAESAVLLKRKIRKLERELGANNADVKRLKDIHDNLMQELKSKRFHAGMLRMMQEATDEINTIDTILANDLATGTELEKNLRKADNRYQCDQILKKHQFIIANLMEDDLVIDQDISQTDLDRLRDAAQDLMKLIIEQRAKVEKYREEIYGNIMIEILGNEVTDGTAMVNAVKMAMKDSSLFDKFYSIGRASNPFVAAVGSIIRRAEISRKDVMSSFSRRIDIEDDKLRKAGFTSKFMYDEKGRIISDIDWDAFYVAEKKAMSQLKKSLIKQHAYSPDAMKIGREKWRENNMVDRVVDRVSGRTERVPDHQYRKPFPPLDPAQREYYENMMQIKGELGTLLPAYAQFHYRPPQKRRSHVDAFIQSRTPADIAKILKNRWLDITSIREDDENYRRTGVVEGTEYDLEVGSFDNTPERDIPIYFINPLSDQNELLKDFSGAMSHFAGTAVNYSELSKVLNAVEFLKEYIIEQNPSGEKPKMEMNKWYDVAIAKDLFSLCKNTNSTEMLETMVGMHFYNETRADWEVEHEHFTKWYDNLLKYTSFKALSTNFKGWMNNFLQLEWQIMLEAGAGEFINFADYAYANWIAFFGPRAGLLGAMRNFFSNNRKSLVVLMFEKYDPQQEEFEGMKHKRYYGNWFRRLVATDLSFAGYGLGEFTGRLINMLAILHHKKVMVNGKKTHILNAYNVIPKKYGSYELELKPNVTDAKDGHLITAEDEKELFDKILFLTQSTQGSANTEDKGIISQKWAGRGVLNFRQWMIGYYSKRYRKEHYDYALKEFRKSAWRGSIDAIARDSAKEAWEDNMRMKAAYEFMKDVGTFLVHCKIRWKDLDSQQKGNIRRVLTELFAYWGILCPAVTAFTAYAADKKERWAKYWLYQLKRLKMDAEIGLPVPETINSFLKILQSPIPGVKTAHDILYLAVGLQNGDYRKEHKKSGENLYWRNIKRHVFPFFKDWEDWKDLPEEKRIFSVFDASYFMQ